MEKIRIRDKHPGCKNVVISWNFIHEVRPSSWKTRPGTSVRQFKHFPEQIQPKSAYTQTQSS
jgi:hypothetical protein